MSDLIEQLIGGQGDLPAKFLVHVSIAAATLRKCTQGTGARSASTGAFCWRRPFSKTTKLSRRISIAKIRLQGLISRLAKFDIGLRTTQRALDQAANAGFDPVHGARPLKRAIQRESENRLAKELLSGKFAAGDTVRVEEERAHRVRESPSGAALYVV